MLVQVHTIRLRSVLAVLFCLLSCGISAGETKAGKELKIPLRVINPPDPKATDIHSIIERAKLEAFLEGFNSKLRWLIKMSNGCTDD